MKILLDANILVRLSDSTSPQHLVAAKALVHLKAKGCELCITSQAIYEFWVVASRPAQNNGLALDLLECEAEVRQFLELFPLLDELNSVFFHWLRLVKTHRCSGKVAHDARYVAGMQAHGITHLLTFNISDFSRFPGIVVIDPAKVPEQELLN